MRPNHWVRKIFPTSHRLLLERSLYSLTLPSFSNVLIVGAGYDPYRSLFSNTTQYTCLDIRPISGITDIVGDALALPFKGEQFDCLFASELLEHLSDPFLFAREAMRVLRPNGMLIITVPFMFHIHGDPHDYWRPTRQGLTELFKNYSAVDIVSYGNTLHVISDLITTAFNPYPIFSPLRIINHLLISFSKSNTRSNAPSGYIVLATK